MELIFYVIGAVLSFVILYLVVRAAVTSALASHYKTVRWYEATGEWEVAGSSPNRKPSQLPTPSDR